MATISDFGIPRAFGAAYHVKQFGAIGNGASNPASANGYGTLVALQSVYPFATAITNEMDWLGTQAAINAAKVAGGMVYSPAGIYVYSNSNSATDASGTLTFPESIPFYPNGTPTVNWCGDGDQVTVHKWAFDLGTGKFGVRDNNRSTANGNYGRWYGMTFWGPGAMYSPANIGTIRSTMSGLGIGSGKDVTDCSIDGFNAGIDFVGGQNKFVGVRVENCYYGFYWSSPATSGLIGDTAFIRCIFQNCLAAAMAVHHAANINECLFLKCSFCVSPWGIFKETNSGAPASVQITSGCTFIQTQFESMGNGAIGDDRLLSAGLVTAMVGALYDTKFIDTYFSWSPTNRWATYGAFVCIAAYDTSLCTFDGFLNAGAWTPGSVGIFYFGNGGQGVSIRGDISSLISNANAAPVAARNIFAATPWLSILVFHRGGPSWDGFGALANNALSTQRLCNVYASEYGSPVVGGQTAGTTADAPAGVTMFVGGGNGSSGGTCIIATSGVVSVNSSGSFSATINVTSQWLRSGPTGTVVAASGSSDTTSPMVGYLWKAPGTTTPATVMVKLKGLS